MQRLRLTAHPNRTPTVVGDERIYAIGDVHGRFDLLIGLLQKIEQDAETRTEDGRRARLVFLGDYIDRGEQSRQVLEALGQLAALNSPDLVFLRGNHEAALLDFLNEPEENAAWLRFGGRETLASFGLSPPPHGRSDRAALVPLRNALVQAITPHRAFLEGLEPMHRSGDVIFVHAAVDPERPIEAQSDDALLWGHPGFLVDDPVPGLRIVHGHYDAPQPVRLPGRICVDTGAYHSGVLTALRLDEDAAFLSSAPLR